MRSVLVACFVVFIVVSALHGDAQTVTASAQPQAKESKPRGRALDCWEHEFISQAGPYKIVRFGGSAARNMISAQDDCLDRANISDCKTVSVDRTHTWYAGKVAGDWVCITDAKTFGWIPVSQVTLLPVPTVEIEKWKGYWKGEYDSADITIELGQDGKTLNLKGNAEWQGGSGVPNLGNIAGSGVPNSSELDIGISSCVYFRGSFEDEPDECIECAAVLLMINDRLLVRDNGHCGGMNVNFNGLYDLGDAKHKLDLVREPQ